MFTCFRQGYDGEVSTIHLACLADETYAPGLAVTVRSALETLAPGQQLFVWLVNGGVSMHTRRKLELSWGSLPLAGIEWLTPDFGAMAALPTVPGCHPFNYLKLELATLVPIDRFVYLDTDVLVRSDISKLATADLAGRVFGAVQDFGCLTVGDPEYGLRMYAELGLPIGQPYCNAGVLVIDRARWIASRATERVVEVLQRYQGQWRYADQEALNAVLGTEWYPLDPRWNSLWQSLVRLRTEGLSQELLDRFMADPYLVHFTGTPKPWLPGSQHPLAEEYRQVLLRTRFPVQLS